MPLTQHRLIPWFEVMGADAGKLFAWEAVIRERIEFTSTGASKFLYSAAVPAGKLWVVNMAYACDATSQIAWIDLEVYDGTTKYPLDHLTLPAATTPVKLSNTITMIPGDKLEAYFRLPPASDLLILSYIGYQMTMP